MGVEGHEEINIPGITSRILNLPQRALDVHILEAAPRESAPLLLLLHGFPELAFSWRKVIVPLAEAGYHVVAPDQRGYGRTVSTEADPQSMITYEDDPTPFRMDNLVKDVVELIHTLGYESCAAVIGHDFGSLLAGFCVTLRPELFKSVIFMSAPFTVPAQTPVVVDGVPTNPIMALNKRLSNLPTPKKHYTVYLSSAAANTDMLHAPQGFSRFLRQYFFSKSGECESDPLPRPLSSFEEMNLIPGYYIMDSDKTMPDQVSSYSGVIRESPWMNDDDLAFYAKEFSRTGFQGGLNMYRFMTGNIPPSVDGVAASESIVGKRIEIPSLYITGSKDWGAYQFPGALELMAQRVCTRMTGPILVEGAGHWVQQENPESIQKWISNVLRADSEV